MTDNIKDEKNDIGSVRISNDVVAIVSGVAATEIKGVVGMSGGITGGIISSAQHLRTQRRTCSPTGRAAASKRPVVR